MILITKALVRIYFPTFTILVNETYPTHLRSKASGFNLFLHYMLVSILIVVLMQLFFIHPDYPFLIMALCHFSCLFLLMLYNQDKAQADLEEKADFK